MPVIRLFQISVQGLSRAKTRTFLMMLGVMIGIATLTVIVAIGKGAEKRIVEGMKNFGPNSIQITAGGGRIFGPPDVSTITLTLEDYKSIRESIKGIKFIAPNTVNQGVNLIYKTQNTNMPVFGVTPEFIEVQQWAMESGEFIREDDNLRRRKVCVLGKTVVKELFEHEPPIGKKIRINNATFSVIGVLESRGASGMGHDLDRRILIPMETAMRRLFNINYIGAIRIYIEDPVRMLQISDEIRMLLRERHHIVPPKQDDFTVRDSETMRLRVKMISGTMTTMLLLISLISLVVGGIVIANIMFIAVNERKREIGIRRAFGAKRSNILWQFIMESLLVTLSGGIFGTVLGVAISKILSKIATMPQLMSGMPTFKIPVVISWEPFLIAFVFSTLIGIFAGLQPARRAAALDIVNAIRS